MKRTSRTLMACCILTLCAAGAEAQTFPTPDYWRGIFLRPATPQQAGPPEYLKEYAVDGKLRLTVADTIRLTLANNTDIQLDRLDYARAEFAIGRAYGPFEPGLIASFNTSRAYPPFLPGTPPVNAAPFSSLSQTTAFSYSQLLQTGTSYSIGMSGSKSASSDDTQMFNPTIGADLDFSFTQPLWRNRGLKINRAGIVIARRNQRQSRAGFEAQVNASIARAVDQYWNVVLARESLTVQRKSLELAEATYARNKRELELGALPPLDIYRSESQVATRRVQVIAAEYSLKRTEDELRRTIGADLDPFFRALDLDLTERAEPSGELFTIDSQTAIERALAQRPELEAVRQQLANDDTNLDLAHNGQKPSLNLTGFYSSSGLGANQIDSSVPPPVIATRGGLRQAFDQLGSFDFRTYGFNLQLELPLKNRAAEANMGDALVSRRRSLYTMRQSEQAITLETRNAVHQLEQAKLSMAASRIARDASQKNLEAEQRKYELGAGTIFFVLDAQNQLAQAEQALVQSQINYQLALTAVERATAALLERHRVQIQ